MAKTDPNLTDPNPPDGSLGMFHVSLTQASTNPNPPDGSLGMFHVSLAYLCRGDEEEPSFLRDLPGALFQPRSEVGARCLEL
jgi:hypothetical protein